MTLALDFPLVKLVNRVLSDDPAAREQLAMHAGKMIAARGGPLESRMRVTAAGSVEMIGEGVDAEPDVAFEIPLALLPRLAQRDDAAFHEVVFTGDSEFAALLSRLARDMEWDVEADLSQWVGDGAAHQIVDTVRRAHAWRLDTVLRFTESVADYLTEEKRLFISRHELESLAASNETLRDDVARLEARFEKLLAATAPS